MKTTVFNHSEREVKLFSYSGRARVETDKFDRVALLAQNWKEWERKLWGLLRKGSQEAFACLMMVRTGVRVGNEGSAKGYETLIKGMEGQTLRTFGLTTLEPSHVTINGSVIVLDFLGKRAVHQHVVLDSPELAKWGQRFMDEGNGTWLSVTDREVYRFVQKNISSEITLKDFRTLCANAFAFQIYEDHFEDRPTLPTKSGVNAELNELLDAAAHLLGNTRGVIKRSYLTTYFVDWFKGQRFDK